MMNQSSSNAVRRPMPASGAKQMSAAAHQQPQQSIQIPIVTFASIVPIPDVVGELSCATEIGGSSAVENQQPTQSRALNQSTNDLQEREIESARRGRDPSMDILDAISSQLADSLQAVQDEMKQDLNSGILVTSSEEQLRCGVDDIIEDKLRQIQIQKTEMENALNMQRLQAQNHELATNEPSSGLRSMENDPLIPGNDDDVDDTNDISQAINPELALPTKTTTSPGADMINDTNSGLLHETSIAMKEEDQPLSSFQMKSSPRNGTSKLSGNNVLQQQTSSRPFGDLTADMFTKNLAVVRLTQIKTPLGLPAGPVALGSAEGASISHGAASSKVTSALHQFATDDFKPVSIQLTPIDDEMAEKALRGKKMSEVTYSKSHREERGLFDYLSHQFIPTSTKRYSALKTDDKKGQKRKREDGSDEEGDLFAPDDGKPGSGIGAAIKVVEPAWKKRKYNRVHTLHDRQMNKKEIKDSSEFKRCAQLLDSLLESVDEGYLSKSSNVPSKPSKKKKKHRHNSESNDEENEEASEESSTAESNVQDTDRFSCPPELQVKRAILTELTTECSKLKEAEIMNVIPVEKLTKLLSVLEHNIRDGTKLALSSKSRQALGAAGEKNKDAWREMVLERVWRAAEASLLALTVLTAPNMPKRVYMEELFETMIKFLHYQFINTIFPEFDPIYRISKEDKEKGDASIKAKRAKVAAVKEKGILGLYNRFCEVIVLLSDLFSVQVMTDTIVLQVSTLAICVFFVENISELQLATLRLITTVFARYSKHRQLIFQEMFSSLSRLPSSKRSLRPFRLTEDEHIQMVTALVLQLIQSVIALPSQVELENFVNQSATAAIAGERSTATKSESTSQNLDIDVILNNCSAESFRTAQTFLSVFLTKCTTKSEEDFRPLFENFVQDLLTTVNKPEWPASEVALSLLGRLLNYHFTAKGSDTALRVACLDYLGVIAARLRKDAVTSKCSRQDIENVIKELKSESRGLVNFEDEEESTDGKASKESFTQQLQRVILDYLQDFSDTEPSLLYAKGYYIAQWFRDMRMEIERCSKLLNSSDEADPQSQSYTPAQLMQKVRESEKQKHFLLSLIHAKPGSGVASMRNAHLNLSYENACLIASYLASERPFMKSFDVYLRQIIAVLAEQSVAIRTKAVKCLTAVVEADPTLLSRVELQHAVNSMFVDSSSNVREAAVDLLSRFVLLQDDLPEKYYGMIANRILDTGISVRKRVVRILRDICIEKPDFPKNTEICCKLIRRINDEESIRKLVLEVFEKLWFTPVTSHHPNHQNNSSTASNRAVQLKINQIVETLRQATDTGFEGFQTLLSILVKDDSSTSAAMRALAEIVDGIMEYMINLEESQDATTSGSGDAREAYRGRIHSAKLMSCLSVMFHIAKIKPMLLVPHANELQPYLATKVSNEFDSMILFYTAAIFEISVPLISNPSETLLTSLQEELMKVIMNGGQNALSKCVSCLTTVVMKVTKNYETLNDCIDKFFTTLASVRACQELTSKHGLNSSAATTGENDYIGKAKGSLSRALYALGLLAQKYDPFEYSKVGLSTPLYQQLRSPSGMSNCTNSSTEDRLNTTVQQSLTMTPTNPVQQQQNSGTSQKMKFSELVADHMLYYAKCRNTDVVGKALTGLGFICSAHPELLLWEKVKSLYFEMLQTGGAPVGGSCSSNVELRELVLHNMEQYLVAEDERLQEADEEFKKAKQVETDGSTEGGSGGGLTTSAADTLKEMGDLNSGMASSIIQMYSVPIFNNFFATQPNIRAQALKVISLVLKQGLVQPVNCVPYLIALSSDTDSNNRNKSHEQLVEIDTKYPGFVHQKASQGLSLAFALHKALSPTYELIRGYRIEYDGQPPHQTCHIEACCAALYSLIRTQRNNRRALVKPLLAMFDSADQFSLRELLFFADNLASFKYLMQDEVFFIIHIIDIQLSISGANILSEFKNMFYPERKIYQQQQQLLQQQQQSAMNDQQPVDGSIQQPQGHQFQEQQTSSLIPSHANQLQQSQLANGVSGSFYNSNMTNINMYGQPQTNNQMMNNPQMMQHETNNMYHHHQGNIMGASSNSHQAMYGGNPQNCDNNMYMQNQNQQQYMNLGDQGYYINSHDMMYGQQTPGLATPGSASHQDLNALQSLAANPQMGSYGNNELYQMQYSQQMQQQQISNMQQNQSSGGMVNVNTIHHRPQGSNAVNYNGGGELMALLSTSPTHPNSQTSQLNNIQQQQISMDPNQHQMPGTANHVAPNTPASQSSPGSASGKQKQHKQSKQHKQQQHQQQLLPQAEYNPNEDDDLENESSLFARYPEEDEPLMELMKQSHACILLCLIKQHLKTVYSVTDSKFQNYSPNEAAKVYEKALSRKSGIKFEPSIVINYIQFGGHQSPVVDPQQRIAVVRHYLEFKDLIMQLDACDEDENGDPIARPLYYLNQSKYNASATVNLNTPHNNNPHGGGSHNNNNDDDPHHQQNSDQQILKNASFMERMQKKSKKGRKSAKKTPVKKKGRKSRVVIHSDSEDDSHDDEDSDPDFS